MVCAFGCLDNSASLIAPVRTEKQTVAYNLRVREEFKRTVRARMGIWEAMEKLSELVDDSDPDVGVSRLFHSVPPAASSSAIPYGVLGLARVRVPSRHLRRTSEIDIFDTVTGCSHHHFRSGREIDLMRFPFIFLDDCLSDRAFIANRGGHETRRETRMDASHRASSRPGKTFVLLWISGPVGRRRRYFCRRLQVFGKDHLPRHVREQPRLEGSRVLDRVWCLQAKLWIGQRFAQLGS